MSERRSVRFGDTTIEYEVRRSERRRRPSRSRWMVVEYKLPHQRRRPRVSCAPWYESGPSGY